MDQKKYYTVDEAAQLLGLTPAEVNLRREQNTLRGFRDGSSWKFKVEDVEAMKRELHAAKPAGEEETPDLLLGDLDLDDAGSSASGTVIGPVRAGAADNDIRLVDSGIDLDKKAEDSVSLGDLEISLDEDAQASLDDDASGTVAGVQSSPAAPVGAGDSAVNLANGGKKLDDDDVVLGGSGSGSGSDITIGGDSGISLLDPTDSGLSLEEPLELDKIDDDSLELGEDDMLTFAEDTGSTEVPAELKKDEEFLLTPLEEAADEEDSESGSQVIALDSPAPDMTATMVAPMTPVGGGAGMAAMLDEDFAAAGSPGLAAAVSAMPAAGGLGAAPLGAGHPVFAEGGPMGMAGVAGAGAIAVPEAPYTGLNITSLVLCLLLILLCGVFAFDLLRNMWSWNGAYSLNSWLMDMILSLFG